MAARSSWQQVALQPWREARRDGGLQTLAAVAAAMAVLLLVLQAMAVRRVGPLAMVLAGSVLLLAWCGFATNLLRQNAPTAARLVPGHVERLRQVLTVGGCAVGLLVALLSTMLFAHALAGGLLAALLPALLVWALRWPQSATLIWMLPAFSWWWLDTAPVRMAWSGWLMLVGHRPWAAALAVAVAAFVLLHGAVQRGGTRRQRRRRRTAGQTALSAGDRHATPAQLLVPAWLRRLSMSAYIAWLQHLCRRPASNAVARALLCLGPSTHWTAQAFAAAVAAVVIGIPLALLWAAGLVQPPAGQRGHLVGPALGFLSAAVGPLLDLRRAALPTRREQALLMLVPGLPRGGAFNRALALRLTLHFGAAWAIAAALGLWLVHGTPGAGPLVLAAVFGSLPLLLVLWRDRSCTGPTSLGPTALLALVLAGTGVLFALQRWAGAGVAVVVLVSVLPTLAVAGWRWRQLARLPAAWPSGRNAVWPGSGSLGR